MLKTSIDLSVVVFYILGGPGGEIRKGGRKIMKKKLFTSSLRIGWGTEKKGQETDVLSHIHR